MPRPKYTKPDKNQSDILQQLDRLGIFYVVTSNLPCNTTYGKPPLDFFTLGYDLESGEYKWVQWECKTDDKAPFTESEEKWFADSCVCCNKVVSVCYAVEDILRAYHRI